MQVLEGDILILPSICLCPIDYDTKIRRYSPETISIHWFDASWQTEEQRAECAEFAKKQRAKHMILRCKAIVKHLLGDSVYMGMKKIFKKGNP